MAKRMQKIHTKLQPSQETDPNSDIEKGKTSAGFASKLKARSSTDAQIKLDKESARYTTKLDKEIGNMGSEEDARLKAR